MAFKSQLRRKGIRVVSITEQAEDNATGRLLEGIIESVDEYYSENLAQGGRPGDEGGGIEGLLPRLQRPLRLQAGSRSATGRRSAPPLRLTRPQPPWCGSYSRSPCGAAASRSCARS